MNSNFLTIKRLLAFIMLLPLSAMANPIIEVSVLDSRFQVIRVLTSDEELALFNQMWSEKVKQTHEPTEQFFRKDSHYKLDIRSSDPKQSRGWESRRWIYLLDGSAQILSKRILPTYKVPSPKEFNKLIGADPE